MARLSRRSEDPTLLWKYHIVPGVYTDQAIYNIAQERFSQSTPQQMTGARPQNNLPTMALPFQVKRTSIAKNFSSSRGWRLDFLRFGILRRRWSLHRCRNGHKYGWNPLGETQTPINQSYFYENNNRLNPYLSKCHFDRRRRQG